MAEATACGIARTLAASGDVDAAGFVTSYVSREHRDARGRGCTLAALCGDASRQPAAIKSEFAGGIEEMLAVLAGDSATAGSGESREKRARAIVVLAQSVGAIMLSRACPDDAPLADEILEVCRAELLASLAPA